MNNVLYNIERFLLTFWKIKSIISYIKYYVLKNILKNIYILNIKY